MSADSHSPSFRGAAEGCEPGIQKQPRAVALRHGLEPAIHVFLLDSGSCEGIRCHSLPRRIRLCPNEKRLFGPIGPERTTTTHADGPRKECMAATPTGQRPTIAAEAFLRALADHGTDYSSPIRVRTSRRSSRPSAAPRRPTPRC